MIKNLRKSYIKNKIKIFFTGFSKKNFNIINPVYKKDHSLFDLKISFQELKNFNKKVKLNLIGEYNVLNSASAIALSLHIGIDIKTIRKALINFSGIQRRLTKVFENKKKEFFDDYAHHPTEIRSVLSSLRKINKNRKIISVFQPHRYSRLKLLKNEFAEFF